MTFAILEDDARRREAMIQELDRMSSSPPVRFFTEAPAMIDWLKEHLHEVVLISLDHDLSGANPGSGRDVVDFIAIHPPSCPVILHTSNSFFVPGMALTLEQAGWKHERVVPFNDLEWISAVWIRKVSEMLHRS